MASSARPRISFVIPTLNRGNYLIRAVRSCLTSLERAPAFSGEVIVLDSESDDGSWERLSELFGDDPRVRCVQNKRGLGPTHSWLDGAALITGDYATFVWSDDYISPEFVTLLGTSIHSAQAHAVIARGVMRNVDDETPLVSGSGTVIELPAETVLKTYAGLDTGIELPVSPVCALFSRAAFDTWKAMVIEWSRRNPVREWLMWRRAIGPDLLLFLVAAAEGDKPTLVVDSVVSQFSSHDESITLTSGQWALDAGYWLAKLWAVDALLTRRFRNHDAERCVARQIVKGSELVLSALTTERARVSRERMRALETELRNLCVSSLSDLGLRSFSRALVVEGGKLILRRAQRLGH